ncbi:MAG: ATP-binding cassette domain-containing protein [Pseudomonadota bacterium]
MMNQSAENAAPAVEIEALTFAWSAAKAEQERFRLEIPAWRLERGARVALTGPSGSGKTTLLTLLSGVATAQGGALRVLGQDLAQLSGPARDRFRGAHIGLIFQMFNLLPYAGAVENALLPLHFAPARRAKAGPDPAAEAARLLGRLGLPPEAYGGAPVSQLSVGQQQRVAAARALIGAPELIIADEPTSALDAPNRDAFLDLLFAEADRSGAALLLVTHDEAVAARFETVTALGAILSGAARGAETTRAEPPQAARLEETKP